MLSSHTFSRLETINSGVVSGKLCYRTAAGAVEAVEAVGEVGAFGAVGAAVTAATAAVEPEAESEAADITQIERES